MDFKRHRKTAFNVLAYFERLKDDPSLIPPDGTLETTMEIAISKALDGAYKHGWHNAIQSMHVSLTRLKR